MKKKKAIIKELKESEKEPEKSEIQKCREHYERRLEDCKILLELEHIEDDAPTIYEKMRYDYGELNEYGLSMDFADFGDDTGDKFFRYQFSWGGPQEEIRIYSNGNIEFWYLDWGTGEHVDGTEFSEFIEYVTGLSINEIVEKVLHFENTSEEPKLW